MIFDSEHADGDGYCAGEEGAALGCPTDFEEQDIDDAACETTGGVDFLAEDEGHLVDEDIAHDTTSCTRDATQHDGRPGGEAQHEGLLDADDVEERETYAVEDEPSVVLAHKELAEGHDPEETEDAGEEVDGVFEPEGGLTYHEVANGATTTGCGDTHDEGSEEVELLGRGQTCA